VVHLALRLTDEEQEQLQRAYTPHPEAYAYTLRGWGSLYRFTPEANAQALQVGEQAIVLDLWRSIIERLILKDFGQLLRGDVWIVEVFAIGVEKETGSDLLLDDACLFRPTPPTLPWPLPSL
jgi:hypothetical protein